MWVNLRKNTGAVYHVITPATVMPLTTVFAHQKAYRSPSWRMRGSPAPVMRPNRALLRVAIGLFRLTRLKTLNPSARNSSLWAPTRASESLEKEASNGREARTTFGVSTESPESPRCIVAEGGFVEPGGNLAHRGFGRPANPDRPRYRRGLVRCRCMSCRRRSSP